VALAPGSTVKILVNQDGWYRVPQATLTGAGFVFPADQTLVHLQMNGQDVPFELHNGNLEFYGQGLDTLYSDSRTYWLSVGATPGQQMPFVRARAVAASPTGSFQTTATFRDRKSYFPGILSQANPGSQLGNNIFGDAVRPATPVSRQLALGNVDTTQSASLRLDLYGLVVSTNPPQHQVNVALNGTSLGSVSGTGTLPMPMTFPVAANALTQGTNTVQLTNPEPYNDAVLTDAYTVTYQHLYVADNNALNFPATPGTPVSVGGFTSGSVRLIDITNPLSPRELLPTIAPAGGGTFNISVTPPAGTTRLYAFVDSGALAPTQVVADVPSTLKSPTNQADFIIIAYKDATHDFISDVQPLANLRQSQGLTVKVVDVQDVFDEFSNPLGAHDPNGIKSFLQYAATNWQNPKPKYVLLAGDASWDPRGYFTTPANNSDFIPTLFFDATFLESPSDDAMSDFNNDGKPELAVGRLPAKTDAQMNTMVSKIVNYDATAPRARTSLLVSDNFDRADYCFGASRPECPYTGFSDDLQSSSLTPNGVTTTRVSRPDGGAGDAAAKAAVISGANAGPVIVNWFGHGAFTSWNGSPQLLNGADAAGMTNTNALSVYLMMTCQTGYFVATTFNGLGESLLLAPNAAVAIWGSTGDTVPFDQVAAAKVATSELFGASPKRLGDAMVDAKNAINDLDVMHTWALLGDPTMKLRIS